LSPVRRRRGCHPAHRRRARRARRGARGLAFATPVGPLTRSGRPPSCGGLHHRANGYGLIVSADPRATQYLALAPAVLVVPRITSDQSSLPTPCESWDVGAVANHLINGLERLRTAAVGETPDWSRPMPDIDGDWAGEFRARADALSAAWA